MWAIALAFTIRFLLGEGDRSFSHHVVEVNQALRAGYRCASDIACVTPLQGPPSNGSQSGHQNGKETHALQTDMPLQADIIELIHQQLRQGNQIGLEFADVRRF